MPDTLIALGGAECVWEDFDAAERFCAAHSEDFDVGAVNDAGADYPGRLYLWCSLHAEKMEGWQRKRERAGRNTDYLAVSNKQHPMARIDRTVNEFYPGSSGLFVCQVALIMLGYARVIVCGMPMRPISHYFDGQPWGDAKRYQKGWREATQQPEFSGRIRSMSGWTRELLGPPDAEWLRGGAPSSKRAPGGRSR